LKETKGSILGREKAGTEIQLGVCHCCTLRNNHRYCDVYTSPR